MVRVEPPFRLPAAGMVAIVVVWRFDKDAMVGNWLSDTPDELLQKRCRAAHSTTEPPAHDRTFSLNAATNPRTAATGYVEAGIIKNGRPARGMGGGVSQLATTLFNAAYFAGMVDVEHQEQDRKSVV